MSVSEDLINFDIIEDQKENIQSLPQGRSAKALATAFGPTPFSPVPTPQSTRTLNDALRAEYEKELANIGDSDDPLDVYDRYIKWTMNAYPSAQATPESQLRPLLERATKAFQGQAHYKNDPRYLKMWLNYIRFFSDAPRETFAYLARHSIGDTLALYYEEFAAWLESAGRWAQAEEVYKMGLEREARPQERLLRKFGEFQQRFEQRPQDADEPSSPALPTVRPALAAKLDPYAATAREGDPQAQQLPSQTTSRGGRQKMAIFSDADAPESAPRPGEGSQGWDNIGTIADRKKENTVGARPWVGETLKAGKKTGAASKMMIFRDESNSQNSHSRDESHCRQTVNPRTGKIERVFVDLDLVYPNPADLTEEYSFEELRARHRGWLGKQWSSGGKSQAQSRRRNAKDVTTTIAIDFNPDTNDTTSFDQTQTVDLTQGTRKSKGRRKKVREVKGETQTIKLNLDSPTGPKIKKKSSSQPSEPTMTFHSKEAANDVFEMFNQPIRNINALDADESGESDFSEDDYTSAGESTCTGRVSGATSEYEDDETRSRSVVVPDISDPKSVSPWSDFTKSKHMPNIDDDDDETGQQSQAADNTAHTEADAEQEAEEDTGVVTPVSPERPADAYEEEPHTRYVPIPPEDYEAPTMPYRDAAQIAQNRLPFMTPIVEQTESSIPSVKPNRDYSNTKTPSRRTGQGRDDDPSMPRIDGIVLDSSPFQEIVNESLPHRSKVVKKTELQPLKTEDVDEGGLREVGPIIKDKQCNPMDDSIRQTILEKAQPPLAAYKGFYDHRNETFNQAPEIRKFIKSISKAKGGDKTPGASAPPVLSFPGAKGVEYTIKRELGKGAFAPVYLASSSEASASSSLVAVKSEDPPSAWEFYIMSMLHRRLAASSSSPDDEGCAEDEDKTSLDLPRRQLLARAAASIPQPFALHLFRDECYLLEPYHDQGTLLDLVNAARADAAAAGQAAPGGLDEAMAVFFTAELLRTLEACHAVGIVHGDVKADNFLVRLPPSSAPFNPSSSTSRSADDESDWSATYSPTGQHGWAQRGLALIDFGRGVDARAFPRDANFIADWRADRPADDCPEVRAMRPWTFHIDYWGAAGVVHLLLFGKWIEDVLETDSGSGIGGAEGAAAADGAEAPIGGGAKRYRPREPFKRYWQAELWTGVFDLLMNPARHAAAEPERRLPALRRAREVREALEDWLAEYAERRGLKAGLRRMEERLRRR